MFRTVLYASGLAAIVFLMREAGLPLSTMVIVGGGAFVAFLIHAIMQDA